MLIILYETKVLELKMGGTLKVPVLLLGGKKWGFKLLVRCWIVLLQSYPGLRVVGACAGLNRGSLLESEFHTYGSGLPLTPSHHARQWARNHKLKKCKSSLIHWTGINETRLDSNRLLLPKRNGVQLPLFNNYQVTGGLSGTLLGHFMNLNACSIARKRTRTVPLRSMGAHSQAGEVL